MHNLFYFCTMWNLRRGFLGRMFKGGNNRLQALSAGQKQKVVPDHCACASTGFAFTVTLL